MEWVRTMDTRITRADSTDSVRVIKTRTGVTLHLYHTGYAMRVEDAQRLIALLEAGIAEAKALAVA